MQTVECMHDNIIRLFQSGSHTNKYEEETDIRKRNGIHYFYKSEINKLLTFESGKTPFAILRVLTKRLTDKCAGYDLLIPLPSLSQLRNYRRTYSPTKSPKTYQSFISIIFT